MQARCQALPRRPRSLRGKLSCRFRRGAPTRSAWEAPRCRLAGGGAPNLKEETWKAPPGMAPRRQSSARSRPKARVGSATAEQRQVEQANARGKAPVVFIHGLWLLPSSWDNWVGLFEENGYAGVTPSWPDDPEAVEEARAHPEVFAGKTLGQVADHVEEVIKALAKKPVVMGHSTGGLLA